MNLYSISHLDPMVINSIEQDLTDHQYHYISRLLLLNENDDRDFRIIDIVRTRSGFYMFHDMSDGTWTQIEYCAPRFVLDYLGYCYFIRCIGKDVLEWLDCGLSDDDDKLHQRFMNVCNKCFSNRQATRLWNWVDCMDSKSKPERCWDIMRAMIPWAFYDPADTNSLRFEY